MFLITMWKTKLKSKKCNVETTINVVIIMLMMIYFEKPQMRTCLCIVSMAKEMFYINGEGCLHVSEYKWKSIS